MILKRFLLFSLLMVAVRFTDAQNATDFKTVKYEDKSYEHPDYKLFIAGAFTRAEIMKVKIRIFNKTNQVIYIKPNEIEFTVNGKTLSGNEKPIAVQPNGDEMRVIDLKGLPDMRCNQFDVVLKGFYKVDPATADVIKTDATTVNGNSASAVSTSHFSCEPKATQTNKEKSFAKYSCVYTGDRIGIIEPGNTVAEMSTGKKNNNSYPRNEIFIMEKDVPQTITIEFRKMPETGDLTDGYRVLWQNVFKTGTASAYEVKKTTVNMDPEKSK